MMSEPVEILDISQPVDARSAVFPGDQPFTHRNTQRREAGASINLTAFTMSPHVGTHADAPLHLASGPLHLASGQRTAAELPLSPYIGPVTVLDLASCHEAITPAQVQQALATLSPTGTPRGFPKRLLLRTRTVCRYDVFETDYASLSVPLVAFLADAGCQLVGLDTPSVDPVESQSLDAHHALIHHGLAWLENLDLSAVSPGDYWLSALPLRFTTLEASPVRAVLLRGMVP